ncbi:unnamed protein product [Ostreobium quekettii]|uniref:PPM-type phosphatase domain-containing protein n=1 Tax=Ostreobium quekettii TaxID=121088 RepID=A0A8S1JE72_9CHLO|nr:unnamed protein product [Ostreobium quekettii]
MGLPAPEYRYAVVQRQVKHEDVFFVLDGLRRCGVDGEADHDWRVFGVADGHGGQHCAEFVKQNLGPTLSRLLPAAARMPSLDTPEGEVFAEAVRRALVEAFTSLHADFEFEGCRASGTTVSIAVLRGWLLTVANVGDSEVFLDTRNHIVEMTCCHKLNDNEPEQLRLRSAGVKVDKLCRTKRGPPGLGENGVGPLRAWPGGIAMSRSLGDIDCGPHVLPVPHVRQVVLPRSGVRLILASDGLWDHLSGVKACKYSRASMLRQAPKRLLSLATSIAGRLSDDTTILTVDILPQNSYDFSDTGDSITRLVVSGVRNLVRKTVVKGRRLLSGSKHGYSYYADVDGLVEYPEVLQTDVSSGSSTPSKSPTPPSSPVTAGSIPVAKEVSGELSKTSSEAWDICSSPWNYNFVGMDPCMSNSPRQNDLAGENWKIMDSAQFYADDTFGNPSKKGPLGQCLLGLAIEEGDSNNSAGEMFEPLHVGT